MNFNIDPQLLENLKMTDVLMILAIALPCIFAWKLPDIIRAVRGEKDA